MIIRHNKTPRLPLINPEQPELYRNLFPYSKVSKVEFDDLFILPRPANPMFITDTTFRDGQQARPPYTVKQIAHIFDLLHQLGGKSGLIRASEFFMYSDKDKKAIEACRAKGHIFPQVTGWIRATLEDLKLAKSMEFSEVGMLTSVSDYHIYLKLGLDRQKAFDQYVGLAEKALEWGITPRCHFEDITRADIHGFCLPLAQKLMDLAKQANNPVKIRLCDTMGYGVTYVGACLPRSVPRIIRAFTDEANVPSEWLEWHGHNDFHKVLQNGAAAWLYGCSGVNSTLLGFGERTGNTPLEALIIEYISLTGNDDHADTRVITEIAKYFETELDYRIPDNYPFVGKDFNATSAGVHVDGLNKNEEIYNIFDTTAILNRPVPIIITDKSGRAGVAYWINQNLGLSESQHISKKNPAVGDIYAKIMKEYDAGRNTSFSNKEMKALVQQAMPTLFPTALDQAKKIASKISEDLIHALVGEGKYETIAENMPQRLQDFGKKYPFIQYLYYTDTNGRLLCYYVTHEEFKENYAQLKEGYDFSQRDWFINPIRTGKNFITPVYQSHFTQFLVLTISTPITNKDDEIVGIMGADIQLETLLQQADALGKELPQQE